MECVECVGGIGVECVGDWCGVCMECVECVGGIGVECVGDWCVCRH